MHGNHMIRDITLGQYYPGKSTIHKLDPRVKLVGTLIYIISLFLINNLIGYLLATLFLASIIKISQVPFKYMVKGLKSIFIVIMITVICNLFFYGGDTIVLQLGIVKITLEGIKAAILMTIRFVYLIIGSSVMTLTTTPNQLTNGLEKGLSPLSKLHFPVHELAMMMSIALRFIPILIEETDKIMKAQMARGADFETGGLIKRAKAMVPLFVPLFVSAFRRANELALAMEARCYHGGEGRTKMKPLVYARRDGNGYILLVLYLAALIATRWLPIGII